ncbi:hypothetical protein [Ensifer adhaerens]|uniref:hypothetical protein n=1 Tax=Ensifer adhaerens TaxID=106592 RepID=UPI0011464287|nr:hypothetical protein [Ensifer adhaerens]
MIKVKAMPARNAHYARRQHGVSNQPMIAASHIVRKRARELLAVLVAILFLFVPMTQAAPVDCGTHAVGSQHAVSSQVKTDLHVDSKPHGPKACCMSVCSLCYAVFPTSVIGEINLNSEGRRDPAPQPSINGITSRPAIGPPRSAG